jgi:endonuclease/exonuclease/phosphatase family metal-dependent hydrolase
MLLLAVVAAPGASGASDVPGAGRAPAELTVVSLNLWHDQHDWPKRLAVILPEMRRREPDVLCLQEVLQHKTLRNQAQTIADSLGYAWHFTSVDSAHREKRYGNAILTRHRLVASGGKNLEPADDYRTVAHVRIDVGGSLVDVYDTHLHHTPEGGPIRATQIKDLLAFVDSTRGDGPVVLTGDFNTELGTPEMRPLEERFTDAFRAMHPSATRAEAVTFNRIFGPDPGAIDHVFVARQGPPRLVPVATEILFRDVGPDSTWASDHFGVLSRLRFDGMPEDRRSPEASKK